MVYYNRASVKSYADPEQTTAGSRWFQTVNNIGTNPSSRQFGVMMRAKF
jgi:hypothetical protein